MSADWYGGVLAQSSWHRLEKIGQMPDAATMIAKAEAEGAWPIAVELETMTTDSGLTVPGHGVVATYQDGSRRCHKAVSERYHFLDPKEWRATIEAATKAGAQPTGAFALGKTGSKVLATFEIGETGSNSRARFKNYLNMADSLDQSCSYVAGGSSIRVVCANTFAAWMGRDGDRAAKIRHTGSINERAEALRDAIHKHVTAGETIAKLYHDAREVQLHQDDAEALLAQLFPAPAEDGRKRTRALGKRAEVVQAMALGENWEGPTLASLWNGATWTVDRKFDDETATHRTGRGGADTLEAMLFGSRGQRIEKVRQVMVTVLRPDGTEEDVPAHQAVQDGADPGQVGKAILADMLN